MTYFNFICRTSLTLLLCLIAVSASAEVKTFTKEYTYQASDFDSRHSSRTLVLEMVKRLLLEELGTYLVSETEVKNMHLTKDQVTTYSAGIVSAEVIEEKWDGKAFWLRAKVSADPKDVQISLKKIIDDKYKSKELEDTRKKAEELTKENERLRKELEAGARVKKPDKKAEASKVKEYVKTIDEINAIEWFIKGYEAGLADRWEEAKNAFTKSIELKPDDAEAYFGRGVAYGNLGNHHQAVKDYTKAIKLKPDDAAIYYNRGNAYSDIGNLQQAIKDYSQAIRSKPDDAEAYFNRGSVYKKVGNKQQAIKDFTKAIELKPDDVDFYMLRGSRYSGLGNKQQAIKDFTKVIELRPDDAEAYISRGLAYGILGNQQQAIKDFKIAARFGIKEAQNFLIKMGERW